MKNVPQARETLKSAANNLPLRFSLERSIGQFFMAPRDLDDDVAYRSGEPFGWYESHGNLSVCLRIQIGDLILFNYNQELAVLV